MKALIIAEKFSLGQKVVHAIPERFEEKDGYCESDNYIVSWASGHLYELKDLDAYFPDYNPKEKVRWRMDRLPFYPENWDFQYEIKVDPETKTVNPSVKKTVKLLQTLMNRKDVDIIYNCGDSDKEGQRICDEIIQHGLKTKKTILRLWLPAQDEETIQKALETAKPNEDYIGFSLSAKARAEMDWLYGIELTRYASIKRNSFVRIGRCVCPIVAQIVARENEIQNFIPKPYSAVVSEEQTNGETIKLTSKRTFEEGHEQEAQQLADSFNAAGAIVSDLTLEKKTIGAPKLFSTADLQSFICKNNKTMAPSDVLDETQKLYEAGYVTYPRTNSSYLSHSELGDMDKVIARLAAAGIKGLINKPKSKAIYDDSKVEVHSAITPTGKMPSGLDANGEIVYTAILNRFQAVFCEEDCTVNRTTMTIHCHDEDFVLKGDIQLTPGWRKYEPSGETDKILPALKKGDSVNVAFKPVGKMTTPPKRYTVGSLNNWMLTPMRGTEKDENEEYTDAEWKEILSDATICTEATRADTIKRCIKSGYISLKKGVYYGEPGGFELVDVMSKLGIDLSVKTTVTLSKQLHAIVKQEMSREDVLSYARSNIDKVFEKNASIDQAPRVGGKHEVLCKCPVCGGDVVETEKAFRCIQKKPDGNLCPVYFSKENKYFASMHKKLTKSTAIALITKGEAPVKGCTSKSGKKYDCIVECKFGEKWPELSMRFANGSPNTGKVLCKCPICGGDIVDKGQLYGCTGTQSDGTPCSVALWKENKFFTTAIHKKMTDTIAKEMFTKGKVLLKGCTNKAGKKYDCTVLCTFKAGEKWPKFDITF